MKKNSSLLIAFRMFLLTSYAKMMNAQSFHSSVPTKNASATNNIQSV